MKATFSLRCAIMIAMIAISRARSSELEEDLFDFGGSDSGSATGSTSGSGSASGSGDQFFETFSEWMTSYNSRVDYRQCMIQANYVASKTLECSNILESTIDSDCVGLPSGECEWITKQILQEEKKWAAEEEMTDSRGQCACGSSDNDCGKCQSDAQENYFKVLNLAQCDSEVEDCGEEDAMKALLVESSTYNALNGVMDTCMNSTSNHAEMQKCINKNMKDELALQLGEDVDDVMLQDYLYDAASNAVMNKMTECATNAESSSDPAVALEQCVSVNAKAGLAASLGMNPDDVSPYMLQDFVQEAARSRTSNAIGSCMGVATTDAERKSCVSGDTLKQTLAASLGKGADSISDATLQEFVTEAATNKLTSVVRLCLAAITVTGDAKVAEVTKCREETACAALASSLGKLSSEFSAFECQEMMETAERKQVKDKMRACVNAVDSTLDNAAQRTARNACKAGSAKAALAAMTGGDASSIATEEMDRYILEAALTEGVPVAMKACMDGIDTSLPEADQATARHNCKDTVAKNTLAEGLGMLPGDITNEIVEEAMHEASVASVRKAFKSCSQLTGDSKTACKQQASETAAKASGMSEITPLAMASVTQDAGMENVVQGMRACLSSNTTCDLGAIFIEGSGLEADRADRRLSDTVQSIVTMDAAKRAAKVMLKRNLQACVYSNDGDPAATVACAKSMGQEAFNALDSNAQSRLEPILRDVLRGLGAKRMKACMADSSMTKTSCMTKVKALMQAFAPTEITDTEFEDAMLTKRASQYSLVFGQTGWVGCEGGMDICLAVSSSAVSSMGGASNAKWNEIQFNARRAAANQWCTCRDSEVDETECEALAQTLFEQQGGTDWSAFQRDSAEDLATGYCAGIKTTVLREDSTEMIFEFHAACSEIDTSTVLDDVTAAATAINSDYTVTEVGAPTDFSSSCLLKYSVAMSEGGYDEAAAASLAETSITATLTSVRRSTSTAETSSSQTTSECSSCTTPTAAPTEQAEVFAYKMDTPASMFNVRRLSSGQILRNSLITAFAGVAGVSESAVTISYLRAARRRAGTVVGFAVTGTVSADLQAQMIGGAFSNAFVAAAAAAGVTVAAPVITIHCPTGTYLNAEGTQCGVSWGGETPDNNSDSEHELIVYLLCAGAGVLLIAIVIGLYVGFKRYQTPEPKGRLQSTTDQKLLEETGLESEAAIVEETGLESEAVNIGVIPSCEMQESNFYGRYAPA